MPEPRYMHEAVIAKGRTGSWSLFVAGGKKSPRNWNDNMWCLDLLPYFRTGLKKTNQDGTTTNLTSEWQSMAPMQSARSNFAMIAMKNFIYVYGGISGAGTGESLHVPTLSAVVIERYVIAGNNWETVQVNSVPKFAAFSWCQMGDSSEIAIVGGTNGDIMSDETNVIDLATGTVQQSSFEFNTAMGTMCYQASKQTLYHMGGMNSQGVDYQVKLDQPKREWSEIDKNHSLVLNSTQLELTNSPSVYFY